MRIDTLDALNVRSRSSCRCSPTAQGPRASSKTPRICTRAPHAGCSALWQRAPGGRELRTLLANSTTISARSSNCSPRCCRSVSSGSPARRAPMPELRACSSGPAAPRRRSAGALAERWPAEHAARSSSCSATRHAGPSAAEALALWLAVAAPSGDSCAGGLARRLKVLLTREELATQDHEAARLRPRAPDERRKFARCSPSSTETKICERPRGHGQVARAALSDPSGSISRRCRPCWCILPPSSKSFRRGAAGSTSSSSDSPRSARSVKRRAVRAVARARSQAPASPRRRVSGHVELAAKAARASDRGLGTRRRSNAVSRRRPDAIDLPLPRRRHVVVLAREAHRHRLRAVGEPRAAAQLPQRAGDRRLGEPGLCHGVPRHGRHRRRRGGLSAERRDARRGRGSAGDRACTRRPRGRNPARRGHSRRRAGAAARASIAVLVQNRPHLEGLVGKLRTLGWPVHAVEIEGLDRQQLAHDSSGCARARPSRGPSRVVGGATRAVVWRDLADLHALCHDSRRRSVWELSR